MTVVPTMPVAYQSSKRLYFSALEEKHIKGFDVAVKAVGNSGCNCSCLPRIGRRKWVPFKFQDSKGEQYEVLAKVSSLTKRLGLKKKGIRQLVKSGDLEAQVEWKLRLVSEGVRRKRQGHNNILLGPPYITEKTSDRYPSITLGMTAKSPHDKTSEKALSFTSVNKMSEEELNQLCGDVSLSRDHYNQMQHYVEEHHLEWEKGNEDVMYLRKGVTGLSRTIFWMRGEGTFVHLKGSLKENFIHHVCESAVLTRNEFLRIKEYVNANRYTWDLSPYKSLMFDKEETGLATDIKYVPLKGLFIREKHTLTGKNDEWEEHWVAADSSSLDPFLIGRGTYKRVYKALHLESNQIVSVGTGGREVSLTNQIIPGNIAITNCERHALAVLDHPNIQKGRVIEYKGNKIDPYTHKPLVKRAVISPWYSEGTLKGNAQQLTEKEKVKAAIDIMEGLNYLHSTIKKGDGTKSWVHLDLKPKNILLERDEKGDLHAILCDLGFSAPVKLRGNFRGGTLKYMAPELILNWIQGGTGTHTDMWAVGVTLYTLFKNTHPYWNHCRDKQDLVETFSDHTDFYYSVEQNLGDTTINKVLAGILQIDPKDRFTASRCLELLKQYQSELDT